MSKRNIITLTLSLLIIVFFIIWGYRLIRKQSDLADNPAISAVPLNTSLIIESGNISGLIKKLLQGNQIWTELTKIETIHTLENDMLFLDSIFRSYPDEALLVRNNRVVVSVHLTGKNEIDFLYILNLSNEAKSNKAKNLLEKLLKNNTAISHRNYDNAILYSVQYFCDDNKTVSFHYSFYKGFFIFGFNPILVEQSIRQLNTNISLYQNNHFRELAKTAGLHVDANIYINFEEFPTLLASFTNQRYKAAVQQFAEFADLSELDMHLKSETLLLNGYTFCNPNENRYLNIFRNLSPVEITIDNILPENTAAFVAYGINDFSAFRKRYRNYMAKNGDLQDYVMVLDDWQKQYELDIEQMFYSILKDQMALAFVDINSSGSMPNRFPVFKIKNADDSREKLLKLLDVYAAKNNKNTSELVKNYRLSAWKNYSLYPVPVENMLPVLFGDMFAGTNAKYYVFIDDYLVFGDSFETLTKYIQQFNEGKILTNRRQYRSFIQSVNKQCYFLFYNDMTETFSLVSNFLNYQSTKSFDKNFYIFRKFHPLVLQFSSDDNDLFFTNLSIRYNPVGKNTHGTVWESRIDTVMKSKPALFTNHYTKEKEIFIQDEAYNIYLINKAGRILWKRQLPEKIMSDVYEIDFYRNNKLQLIFSTRSKIYLIDRKGRDVADYPFTLQSPATNGVAVFDYDNRKDYRMFVACVDKKIYAYTKEGKPLDGWEFEKTGSVVSKPVQHFRIDRKDYIVFADDEKIYILNRKGQPRVVPETQFSISKNNIMYAEAIPKTRFVTTDENGIIHYINTNGKVEKKEIRRFTYKHFFLYQDITYDGYKDIVFVDNQNLMAFKHNLSPLFRYVFDNKIVVEPAVYTFSYKNKKIGIVSPATHRIYLIKQDGTIQEGFPLHGNTPFTIGYMTRNARHFNLFVGGADNYLYNYKLETESK